MKVVPEIHPITVGLSWSLMEDMVMERFEQLGVFHLAAGFLIVIMAVWALDPSGALGTEPQWHAALKLIFGAVMMAAGVKLLRG